MRRFLGLLLVVLAAGCARVDVATEVQADGSFSRTAVYRMKKQEGMPSQTTIGQLFNIPKAAPGIKVEESDAKDETKVTVSRTLAAGTVLKDVRIQSGKTAQLLNAAEVKPLGDGRFAYVETFTWTGKTPDLDLGKQDRFVKAIEQALPAGTPPAKAQAVVKGMVGKIWQALFGPGDPIIGNAILHPGLAERTLTLKAIKAFDESAREEGVADEAREAAVQRFRTQIKEWSFMDDAPESAKNPEKAGEDGGLGLIPMLFTVKVPGRVVETNGTRDPYSNEVAWAFYPEAAAIGELRLKVVYQMPPR